MPEPQQAPAPEPEYLPQDPNPEVPPEKPEGEPEGELKEKTEEEPTPKPESEPKEEPDSGERIIPKVEDYVLPEGVSRDMAEFASKNDLTQAQLDESLTYFGQIMAGQRAAEHTMVREAGEKLVESWGDERDSKLTRIKQAVSQFDSEDGEMTKLLDSTGYGNHPAIIKYFDNLSNLLQEGGFLKSKIKTPVKKNVTAASAMFGKSHPSKHQE